MEVILLVKAQGGGLVGVVQEGFEVGAGEAAVAIAGDMGFEDGHAVEIAEEVRAPDFGGIDTSVAQFAEEAAIAAIDGKGDTTEIADEVVGSTSVDVVDSLTGRDLLIQVLYWHVRTFCLRGLFAPSDIDGMGSKDAFFRTKSILELQIFGFAMRVGFSALYRGRIFQYFPFIGIDAHADYATLTVVGVERDVILGVRADIGDPHVVKEEGRADQIRLADDFKAALSQPFLIRNFIHKHRQSEGCLFRLAVQK